MSEATYKLTKGRTLVIERDEDAESPREWENAGTMVHWHRRSNIGDVDISRESDAMEAFARKVIEAINDPSERSILYKAVEKIGNRDYCDDKGYFNRAKYCEDIEKAVAKVAIFLPVYLYEHSGQTVSTKPFSCPWDSGQVGYIFMTKEKARKEFTGGHWSPVYTEDETGAVSRGGWIPGSGILTKGRIAKAKLMLETEVKIFDNYLTGEVYGYRVLDKDGNEEDSCWGFFGSDIETNGILDSLSKSDRKKIKEQL